MIFIDTHTHCTDEAFAGEEDKVVERAQQAGVAKMLLADIDSSERGAMFSLAERHPGVLYPMLGLYPGSVRSDWREELDRMQEYRHKGIVAVGEIGLDYHYSTEFASEQREAFRVQLELASQWDLPVNIHLRDATEDFFKIIEDCKGLNLRGNLHAFSGSYETFERVSRCGDWYVGIGGVVTFKNSKLPLTLSRIPLERILLETDAPYLAPTPLRGTRNESANIPLIAAKIAEIKNVSIEQIADITTASAVKLFNL